MGLNDTPVSERAHIGIFGRTNAGKSSLINSLTGQAKAVVSDVAGTTTDPVAKTMELLPAGPVVIIDTPGIDDSGELGKLRVEQAYRVLAKTDLALVVTDGTEMSPEDLKLIGRIKDLEIPYIVVHNKTDENTPPKEGAINVSALTGFHINELKELIAKKLTETRTVRPLISDLINREDKILLVIPIDKAAPRGRIILPQQAVLRESLDSGAVVTCVRDTELESYLKNNVPDLVVTDSQVFGKVKDIVSEDIPLTSFSILMARFKGFLDQSLEGIRRLDELKEGDKILIAEGCTHHRQCGDIGSQKIPAMITKRAGFAPVFEFVSGGEFPADVSEYKLVIHCGGCMLNEREMKYRSGICRASGVPMTNYGILISEINGILKRALRPLNK